MPFDSGFGGLDELDDGSDEVISCDGDDSPVKDGYAGDCSIDVSSNVNENVKAPRATGRLGGFSAMLNSGKPIIWHGLKNGLGESRLSSGLPEAVANVVEGAIPMDDTTDGGSAHTMLERPKALPTQVPANVPARVIPINRSFANNAAKTTTSHDNRAKSRPVNGLSSTAKPKSISQSGPTGMQRRSAAQPVRQSNGARHANLSGSKLLGTSNQSNAVSRPATIGTCKECSTRGAGQTGPAGTEYENDFYCNACWSSWGLLGGAASSEQLSETSSSSETDSTSPTGRRCKECLKRGPGQMGPSGTQYAESFYCNDCWSSWGMPGGIADADEEFVSPAELEVAALLAWCKPGYCLGTLQSVERDVAEAEFKRFCAVVGDAAIAGRISERLLQLAKASIATLKMELKKLGFPSVKADDAVLQKRLLLAHLKEVFTWQELSGHDLAKVCAKKKLTDIPICAEHADLFKLLVDDAWNKRGIPADKLQSRDLAFSILDKIEMFEKKSQQELSNFHKGTFAGTCLEGVQLSRQTLVSIAHEVLVWESLTTKQVVELCLEQGIELTGVNMQEALDSSSVMLDATKGKIVKRLLEKWGSDFLEAQSKLVERVLDKGDRHLLLQEFRRLEDLPFEQLRQEYQHNWGLPVEPGMEAKQICSTIKSMLVWNKLPVDKLQKELAEWTQSFDCSGKNRDELLQQLMVESAAARYNDLGIPVYRIEHMHRSIQVVREWERLERMTDVMLTREWKRNKFQHAPEGITPEGVKRCLRSAAVWTQLPSKELITECHERGISLAGLSTSAGEEERHKRLKELLVESASSAVYCESNGIPVEKIASVEAALQLLSSYQRFDKMNTDELIAEYKKFLPIDEHLDDGLLLQRVKDIHLWAVLQLPALKEECQKRGVRYKLAEEKHSAVVSRGKSSTRRDDELQNCEHLRDRLLLTFCECFFRVRGIPVTELGSVKVCNKVFQKFHEFARMSPEALSEAHLKTRLPRPNGVKTADFLHDLQQYTIWIEAPTSGLRIIAHHAGVSNTVEGRLSDGEARTELIKRLVAGKQMRIFESHGIPVRRLDSNSHAAKLLEVFERLEMMSDAELVQECSRRGFLAPPPSFESTEKLKRMKWAISTQDLPFVELRKECVSSGVRGYHNATEERRPEMLQKVLAMMWDGIPSKGGRASYRRNNDSYQPQARSAGVSQLAKDFQALGLPTSASIDDVKKAYKKLALKYHPDKQEEHEQDAGAKFLEISKAYETLCARLEKFS